MQTIVIICTDNNERYSLDVPKDHTIEYNCDINIGTVMDIKNFIFKQEGIPPLQQKLVFWGDRLEDCKSVASYNINIGSILYLILNLRGGGGGNPPHYHTQGLGTCILCFFVILANSIKKAQNICDHMLKTKFLALFQSIILG